MELEAVIREVEGRFNLPFRVRVRRYSSEKEAVMDGKEPGHYAYAFFDGETGEIILIDENFVFPRREKFFRGIFAEEFGHLKYFSETEDEEIRDIHTNLLAYSLLSDYFAIKNAISAGFGEELKLVYTWLITQDISAVRNGVLEFKPLVSKYPAASQLGLDWAMEQAVNLLLRTSKIREVHSYLINPQTYEDENLLLDIASRLTEGGGYSLS